MNLSSRTSFGLPVFDVKTRFRVCKASTGRPIAAEYFGPSGRHANVKYGTHDKILPMNMNNLHGIYEKPANHVYRKLIGIIASPRSGWRINTIVLIIQSSVKNVEMLVAVKKSAQYEIDAILTPAALKLKCLYHFNGINKYVCTISVTKYQQ